MSLILHPSYFMDVMTLQHIYRSNNLTIEMHDSYVKQTYRNRCVIAAANGKLSLNIPIIHQGQATSVSNSHIEIDHSQPWASNHMKSICSAYRSSPYFEYYEDDFKELFLDIPELLLDWNLKTMRWLCDQLNIATNWDSTDTYKADQRARYLITAKKQHRTSLDPYMQVFQEKHGFLDHLSALDLLFNLGPSSRDYLKNIDITLE